MAYTRAIGAILDSLHPLGPVRSRAMFGGHGIYLEDTMFGLVADGVLYLKVDAHNRRSFEREGQTPFTYIKNGKPVQMSFWRAPEVIFSDERALLTWARPAVEAAQRAKSVRRRARPRK